jgi:hypothetical protein
MNRFLYILFAVHFTPLGVSCTKYDQQIEITDLTKPQTIVLHKKPQQKDIVSMSLRINGKIDGEAQLSLMLNGNPYKTETIKGKINIKWGGDWYADSMQLRYEPHQTVKDGKIKIEYVFNGI